MNVLLMLTCGVFAVATTALLVVETDLGSKRRLLGYGFKL